MKVLKVLKVLILFSFISVFSQNKKLDSLHILLKNNIKKDTVRVNLLNKIASDIFKNDKEKSLKLANEALAISKKLNYIIGKAEANYIRGKVFTMQFDLDKAEVNIKKAFIIFKNENNKLGIAKCINHEGIIFFYRSNYDKALEYFYKAIEANKFVNDKIIEANAYNNIGIILNNRNELTESLKYYNLALKVHREHSNYKYLTTTLNNIGIIYIGQKKYNEANEIYKESIEISIKNNDDSMLANSYYFMGVLKAEIKEYKQAHDYYFKAKAIQEKIKSHTALCITNIGISKLFFEQNKTNISLKYIRDSEVIANKYSLLNQQQEIKQMFSSIYYKFKKYEKSLEYYIDYKKYYDSTINIESINKLEDLKLKYKFKSEELLNKEKELQFNNKIKKANDKLNTTYKNILYGIVLSLLLITILGAIVYKSRLKRLHVKNQKINLEQRLLYSQMKPHFIFNSLSVLQGIVLQKEFNKAQKYISKFSRLLRVVLEKSREETINLETELVFIENYILLRNMSNKELQCMYNVTIDSNIIVEQIYIPPMILQPIIENSFEHGFIKLNKNYILSIDFKLENNKLICTIIDNGEGFNKDNVKNKLKASISSTIISERLNLYATEFHKEASVKIIERNEVEQTGVKVILVLPYKIIKNA